MEPILQKLKQSTKPTIQQRWNQMRRWFDQTDTKTKPTRNLDETCMWYLVALPTLQTSQMQKLVFIIVISALKFLELLIDLLEVPAPVHNQQPNKQEQYNQVHNFGLLKLMKLNQDWRNLKKIMKVTLTELINLKFTNND